MRYSLKRSSAERLDEVQTGNRAWWTDHTMSYDWKDKVARERFSGEWFDEIDRRFIHGARLYGHGESPFDRIIPFDALAGRRVLEIGCGMGLHSELMARAGAHVTAVDISDTSIEATRRRAEVRCLAIVTKQMDATRLEFPDETFDFVWSWGVIHHSSQTGRIVKEIHRVLKPGEDVRVMVYNLGGMSAYITLMKKYALGFWTGRNLDESLWQSTDGYMARFYTADILADMFGIFFDNVRVQSLGQDADAIPLPRMLREPIVRRMSHDALAERANRRGSFLFVTATKSQK
jgi:2-polyprenyl-3-methyl-5-hydroxy-6-metoxy-1,4-benzoquinol methylase